MIICIETHFDAAHFLPNYNGKCANTHGHTYRVTIEVQGDVQENGMVEDFSILKSRVKNVIETLDHCLLNDIIPNPTAENIAMWIKKKLQVYYKKLNVTVYEGLNNSVSTGW